MSTNIHPFPIVAAGSDQGRTIPQPARAPENSVPGLMPELHTVLMQHDQAFVIQTDDGALRCFICLNGSKAGTSITVYYTPDDEDGCELFCSNNSMPRESGYAKLYLGSGVLARIVERDGRTLKNYQLPSELDAEKWSDEKDQHGMHYAIDAGGRLALGYRMPSSGFQVVNGPKNFMPVKYQPAAQKLQQKGAR